MSKKRRISSGNASPGTRPAKIPKKATDSNAKARPASHKQITYNVAPTAQLQAFGFGEGEAGELGLGIKSSTGVSTPRPNPLLSNVVSVATGGMHGAALTSDNKVLTWGVNDLSALGRDTAWEGKLKDADADSGDSDDDSDVDLNPREATPAPVPDIPTGVQIVQIAAGDSATMALTEDGRVYGWGTFRDNNGPFGFTVDSKSRKVVKQQREPMLIPDLTKIKSIAVGADYALALNSEGRVFAWGTGQQQQLGRRVIKRRRSLSLLPTPMEFSKHQKIRSIHAGQNHAFAIDSNGETWAWGSNNFGQTGIASAAGEGEATILVPRKVTSLAGKKMKMVAGGTHHSVGITEDGKCLVWGRIDGGQTGLDLASLPVDDPAVVVTDERGRPRILLRPTVVPIPPCTHITAGSDHCIAITADGKAYSWGFNVNYQCGQGNTDDILVAKLMNGKHIRDRKIVWAGAGGQYSMLASHADKISQSTNCIRA
ncbi:MAG: hypothetical protein Q9162_001717 [Coniocarpon cinnabarinum]